MDGIQNEKLIDSYSRTQAIGDGLLVDITRWTQRAGILFPVAMSHALYHGIIEPDDAAKANNESFHTRLGNCVRQLYLAAKAAEGDRLDFQITATIGGKPEVFTLYATLLPGDNLEPVITVMLQDED
jgi:hypothetical protein